MSNAAGAESPMMDLVKPFMQMFGRLAAQFGPTPMSALKIMQQEDPAVLEMEARRVLSLANTRGIQ
jgi:hypothetical protein